MKTMILMRRCFASEEESNMVSHIRKELTTARRSRILSRDDQRNETCGYPELLPMRSRSSEILRISDD